jgi:CsoR family transcriptional regulator, copper-sensing transcriptional repressor
MLMARERLENIVQRLRRLEGQVQGIQRMVRGERPCMEVLTQLAAVRGAVQEVELLLLRGHLETCVAGAVEAGNPSVTAQRIDAIIATLARMRH